MYLNVVFIFRSRWKSYLCLWMKIQDTKHHSKWHNNYSRRISTLQKDWERFQNNIVYIFLKSKVLAALQIIDGKVSPGGNEVNGSGILLYVEHVNYPLFTEYRFAVKFRSQDRQSCPNNQSNGDRKVSLRLLSCWWIYFQPSMLMHLIPGAFLTASNFWSVFNEGSHRGDILW